MVSLRPPMAARLTQIMSRRLRASCVCCAALAMLFNGCERRSGNSNSRTSATQTTTTSPSAGATTLPVAPAAAAATTNPTTEPSTARPRAVMAIDQRRYEFPPAILRVKHKNEKLLVLLMSDDPKDALDDNYAGNSFYLEMPVEAADLKDLSSAVWNYAAPSSERSDSPDGIFLDGNKQQLQASNVTVRFEADATDPEHPKAMAVDITGTFLMFDTHDDNVPAKLVPVVAHLAAEVKLK
jgi:hypothetical protein